MSAKAIAFKDDLARAREIAAERRRALEEAPELTAEEIIKGFSQELRCVSVDGFGKVYFYDPMGADEGLQIREKLGDGSSTTAAMMAEAIIVRARNSDGTQKFKPEHAAGLLKAPTKSLMELAAAVVNTHRFSVASAEKK